MNSWCGWSYSICMNSLVTTQNLLHRYTDIHTQRHKHTYILMHRHEDNRQIDIPIDWHTHADRHTDRQIYTLTSSELWSSILWLSCSVDTLWTGVPAKPNNGVYRESSCFYPTTKWYLSHTGPVGVTCLKAMMGQLIF